MRMKANWWAKRIMAASMGMVMLFTGNTVAGKGPDSDQTETIARVETTPTTEVPPETAPTPTQSWENPEVYAERAASADGRQLFVYDVSDRAMRFCAGEETERLYPASITKLWSALVALMYLDPKDVAQAGSELKLVQQGSSRAYIARGSRLTVKCWWRGC